MHACWHINNSNSIFKIEMCIIHNINCAIVSPIIIVIPIIRCIAMDINCTVHRA